jgi:FtsP/CotA-like multicopper oxidase with cupredoxin domain
MRCHRLRLANLVHLTLAVLTLSLGAVQARAESPAQEDAPRPSLIPSPKGDGTTMMPMRRMTQAERQRAALRALERKRAAEAAQKAKAAPAPAKATSPAGGSGVSGAAATLLRMALAQVGTPDLFASPNYANSKLPTATCSVSGAPCQMDADCPQYAPPFFIGPYTYPGGETCTGPVRSGGIRKFVDQLAPLCPLGTNNLGNCLPVAVPDTTAFPGSDYYEIGFKEYLYKFHSDLASKTRLRGYYQKNTADPTAGQSSYLGPVIIAQSNRPVRVRFLNELPTGAAGDLFIPVDTHIAGTGVGPDGLPYTQNRATVHLHGGNTPWISDGTQHQWTAPAGEDTTHKKGLSVGYVPDMWFDSATGAPIPECAAKNLCTPTTTPVTGTPTNDPGDGALTFYWPNQQSGRFMFYHEHAYGITRLGVYAGAAAGYLLVNPPDEDALAAATVPGTLGTKLFDPSSTSPTASAPDLAHVIPLVIQDRTFVPPAAQLAQQDPTWDPAKWGGEDQLWFPHVYTPNQWPGNPDNSGANPFGRWDYGPWFWPPQTSLAEVNEDGVTIPRPLTVPCTTMSGVPTGGAPLTTECPNIPLPSLIPESFHDTPVVNGTAYPALDVDPVAYRFQILNAANERYFNLSFFVADASGKEVVMADAVPHYLPNYSVKSTPPLCAANAPRSAVTGTPNGPDLATPTCWPQEWPSDGRIGGVPDPAFVGPQWVQIGSEAGILPAPALIPPTPVGYEQNKRNIVVLNVSTKGLFLGPAERADVVVDFSAYAGKTLILYNDSPAPVPAGDPRLDYFTGDSDQTTTGGAPVTQPGYGPNIRTIMQVRVAATPKTPRPPLDVAAVTAALGARFKASQPAPIVPEAAYSSLYSPDAPFQNTYLPIQATQLTFTPVGQTSPVTLPLAWKAIHELFSTDLGRMNSLLGAEIPLTSWTTQTTIPFANFDPVTDFLPENQPQIWKITHNGVDTHAIHFHLFNAQVLNRVGWDGAVRAPDANELGWKETVRMNPLEDIYVALKPVKQTLPFPLPDLWRPLDVDRKLGTSTQFTGVDIYNNPITVLNQKVNYGWEYVWHCHLLGHEEEDMLRAEVFVTAPEAPSQLAVSQAPGAAPAITFNDNSKSALSFTLQRSSDPTFATGVAQCSVPAPAAQPGAVTTSDCNPLDPTVSYFYRVRAEKVLTSQARPNDTYQATSAWSDVVQLGLMPALDVAPAALDFGAQTVNAVSTAQAVVLSATGGGQLALGLSFTGASAADFAYTTTCGGTLQAGAACAIAVTFKPSALGAASAVLAITTSDPERRVVNVRVSGVGAAPVANVSPLAWSFTPGQVVGTSSAAKSFTITNGGTQPLAIAGAALSGQNAADFAAVSGCPASVPAGGSCTVDVTFTPSAAGVRGARLTVTSSDPLNPAVSVTLDGVGIAPLLGASPVALTFVNQLVTAPPTASAAQRFLLANSGTAAAQALTFTLFGANAAEFAFTTSCGGGTLAAGTSCSIDVTFAPRTVGPKTAFLEIAGTDGASPLPLVTVALSGSDVAPVAVLAPSPLSFPGAQAQATTSALQTLLLSNAGSAPLLIGGIAISGDFAIAANGCGASLVPGGSCALGIAFTPTAAGARTGAVVVTSSDPVNPVQSAALQGVGSALAVSPSAVLFGGQLVGTTSAGRSVTLVNTGNATLSGLAGAVSGANAADFTLTSSCGTTLAAGGSCAFTLRYRPGASGASAAVLTVTSSDAAGPQSVALTGTGIAPVATVAPSALTTFSTPLNVASAPQTVTVTNTGTAPLTVTGVALGGTDRSQFTQTSNCVGTVAVGASCTVSVTFRPTAFGGVATKTATLTVSVAAPATAQTVTLSGTIVVPTFTLAPASLTFAKQKVNTTSAKQTVTLTNTGAAPLGLRGITRGGTNASSFAQTNSCGTSVAAGATCAIDVTFTPTRAGTRTATLNVRVAAPAVSQSVALTGTGQ